MTSRETLRFEVLLYLSLLIDTLSAAFIERTPADIDEAAAMSVDSSPLSLLMFFLLLVWLAARQRKNWARWMLVVARAVGAFAAFGDLARSVHVAARYDRSTA